MADAYPTAAIAAPLSEEKAQAGWGPHCRHVRHAQCSGFWDPGQLHETNARHICLCPCHEGATS